MTRRAYLYFALTFLLGALLGGGGVFSYAWYGGRWHRNFNKQGIVRHMRRDLNLTEVQVQQLSQILDEYANKYQDLGKRVEPQFTALREERRNRIRQILTPEQLVKFNELVRRSNERMKKFPPPR